MNIKEAIAILVLIRDFHYIDRISFCENHIIRVNKVISLLQQGEKYQQMWEEMKYGNCRMERDDCLIEMGILEQKYFPKGGERND